MIAEQSLSFFFFFVPQSVNTSTSRDIRKDNLIRRENLGAKGKELDGSTA